MRALRIANTCTVNWLVFGCACMLTFSCFCIIVYNYTYIPCACQDIFYVFFYFLRISFLIYYYSICKSRASRFTLLPLSGVLPLLNFCDPFTVFDDLSHKRAHLQSEVQEKNRSRQAPFSRFLTTSVCIYLLFILKYRDYRFLSISSA